MIINAKIRWAVCIIYTALIVTASLMSAQTFKDVPRPIPHMDKIVHVLIYGLYALIIVWTFGTSKIRSWKPLLLILIYCSLFGVMMEFLQEILKPGDRSKSIADMISNSSGATIAIFSIILSHKTGKKK